ncbi:MAG: type II secretion system protein GspG [Candidatus Omnitrophica bacterium]|nr:type II secretion system protein GspG [Candidatus Omnitrophota bacterium]
MNRPAKTKKLAEIFGITLIEMLITTAILGFLAAIAIPGIIRASRQGNISVAKQELKSIQSAIELFHLDTSLYPTALSDLTSGTPPYMYALPKDHFAQSNDYGYSLSPASKHYVIYSVGDSGIGSASVDDSGNVTETDGDECIYMSDSSTDTIP